MCRVNDSSDSHHRAGESPDPETLFHKIGPDISISCLLRCSRSDYGPLACVNRSFRSLIKRGEIYRLRRLSSVVEHWVYFSCDSLNWVAFDPTRDRWISLPRMTTTERFFVSDKESLAVGTDLLVFATYVAYHYSILTNSWASGTTPHTPRCLFGSASLGETAIVAGGWDENHILSSAEMYNSETQQWKVLPSMNRPRKMCSSVFMIGKFYVIGGIGEADAVLTCGEEYNLETRTWTEIPNMAPSRNDPVREAPPLIAAVNGRLFAADYANMAVMRFDMEEKCWVALGSLPERASSTHGWGIAFRGYGDRLVVVGGPWTYGQTVIEIYSWVPGDGPPEWKVISRMRSGSFVHNCAVMGC